MPNLYLTADAISPDTGAGKVVYHESEALKTLGPCEVWERTKLDHGHGNNPWLWDEVALYALAKTQISLAHCYSGTFSKTVKRLKEQGCKVTYTVAAHSVDISRREHHRCGIPYDYPHLTDPAQFRNYEAGYKASDVIICPSRHSADVMRAFGCSNRIEVIPHGVDVPDNVSPLPSRFIVGYTGAYGPDKGVIYLLQAWRKLNYPDAVLLLGGRDSTSMYVASLLERFGGGNIGLLGWLDNVSDFYNRISLYCQPSASEGFGCEVLEAAAHGRPVIASTGCGAADVLPEQMSFPACNVNAVCSLIELARRSWDLHEAGKALRQVAMNYTWDKIRSRYVEVWKSLMGGK